MSLHETSIMGIPFADGGKALIYQEIRRKLGAGERIRLATPNPEFLVLADRDPKFRTTLQKFDIRVPDGAGLIWIAKLFKKPLVERVSGVDTMDAICGMARDLKLGVFLFGERRVGANIACQEVLKKRYSGLRVDGIGEVHVSPTIEGWSIPPELQTKLENFGPCVLFVALGQRKQEEWILEHFNDFPEVRLAAGVGGAFLMIANIVPRAPKWVQKIWLEWLWRLAVEPWRLKRIFRAVVEFQIRAIVWELKYRKS